MRLNELDQPLKRGLIRSYEKQDEIILFKCQNNIEIIEQYTGISVSVIVSLKNTDIHRLPGRYSDPALVQTRRYVSFWPIFMTQLFRDWAYGHGLSPFLFKLRLSLWFPLL